MAQDVLARDEWWSSRTTSAVTGVAKQTLANWRHLGIGPPYTKLTPGRQGRVRYKRADVERWLREREIH